jgi:hypothetical protein
MNRNVSIDTDLYFGKKNNQSIAEVNESFISKKTVVEVSHQTFAT